MWPGQRAAARWPGHIQPGIHTDRNVLTMDVFPTVCEATGTVVPSGLDATSFLPTLLGKPQQERQRDHYFVRREGGVASGGKTIEAFIRGDWKLLQDSPFAPLELYNIARDPQESTDLAAKEPNVLRSLSAELRRRVQYGGQIPWQRTP